MRRTRISRTVDSSPKIERSQAAQGLHGVQEAPRRREIHGLRVALPSGLLLLVGFTLLACDKRPEPCAEELIFHRPAVLEASVAADATRVPEGYERGWVVGVEPTQSGFAVGLRANQRVLPVFVGEIEGMSIQLRLEGQRFQRPLTHDLMDSMLETLGAKVASVRVERFEDESFHSVVVLRRGEEIRQLDARTSDAVALALGHGAPIFVKQTLLESTGVPLEPEE